MNDDELNRRELTGDQALRFAREAGMEEASRQSLFYAGVGDLIRFARLVREGWTPPRAAGVAATHAYQATRHPNGYWCPNCIGPASAAGVEASSGGRQP